MSTGCQIEIWDRWNYGAPSKGTLLYHHNDGYPEFMYPKLKKFLNASYEYLKEAGYSHWWDSERVAAVMIALSIEDYYEPLMPIKLPHKPKVPVFQPSLEQHENVEYLWRVYLGPKDGEFYIECYQRIQGAWDHDRFEISDGPKLVRVDLEEFEENK